MPEITTITTRRTTARRRIVRQPPDVTIDGEVPYQQGWAAGIPPDPGVYLIYDQRGLLYVGRSIDLRRRFHEHLEFSHNELLRIALANSWGQLRFAWIVDQNPAELEEHLIALLMPICNERRYSQITTTIISEN